MNERGRALGLIGSFVSIGAIAGPGIGGLILGQLPWGYIFLDQYSDWDCRFDPRNDCFAKRSTQQARAD